MPTYLVTKDLPITFRVQAEDEEAAREALNADAPTVYGAVTRSLDRVSTEHEVWCGDWYDDTDVDLDPTQEPMDS